MLSTLKMIICAAAEFSPFLCGAKRQTLSVSKNAEQVPGPGSYCIKEPQKHIPERSFYTSYFKIESN